MTLIDVATGLGRYLIQELRRLKILRGRRSPTLVTLGAPALILTRAIESFRNIIRSRRSSSFCLRLERIVAFDLTERGIAVSEIHDSDTSPPLLRREFTLDHSLRAF